MEKVTKKYQLNNSYFKNRFGNMPSNPFEVHEYVIEHKELPFNYQGDNWLLDMFTEYQKRAGVFGNEFFTPDTTAKRMAELANEFFTKNDPYVLDACCGFGQLTKELKKFGFIVSGFDQSYDFKKIYEYETAQGYEISDFRDYKKTFKNVVSNPPYPVKELTDFLDKLHLILEENGRAVLLVPVKFFEKERPQRLVSILNKFEVLHKEKMTEEFARTKTNAEIVVVSKL